MAGTNQSVGRGAQVTADLPVTAGQPLYVEVGGPAGFDPSEFSCDSGVACLGGFNGGGSAFFFHGGGGGASDVRTVARDQAGTLGSRVLVAAGGGGAGLGTSCNEGGAGGDTDAAGAGRPSCNDIPAGVGGGAGTAGAGGSGFPPGTLGQGGGGDQGGAGAGGVYGGGAGSIGGGGGGGSSLVPAGGSRVLTAGPSGVTISYSTATPVRLAGFVAPVDMGGVVNTAKGGSSVPLKFEAFSGDVELTDPAALGAVFTARQGSCDAGAPSDEVEFMTTGNTSLRYDATAGQFVQNWKTPKRPGTCYTVTVTTTGGSALTALFRLR